MSIMPSRLSISFRPPEIATVNPLPSLECYLLIPPGRFHVVSQVFFLQSTLSLVDLFQKERPVRRLHGALDRFVRLLRSPSAPFFHRVKAVTGAGTRLCLIFVSRRGLGIPRPACLGRAPSTLCRACDTTDVHVILYSGGTFSHHPFFCPFPFDFCPTFSPFDGASLTQNNVAPSC